MFHLTAIFRHAVKKLVNARRGVNCLPNIPVIPQEFVRCAVNLFSLNLAATDLKFREMTRDEKFEDQV